MSETDVQASVLPVLGPVGLGLRLRALRKAAGLTQTGLALKIGRQGKDYRKLISRLEEGSVRQPEVSLFIAPYRSGYFPK